MHIHNDIKGFPYFAFTKKGQIYIEVAYGLNTMNNPILEGTKYVIDHAQLVSICHEKIPTLPVYDKPAPAQTNGNFRNTSKEKIASLFVEDTLNFCFWNNLGKEWSVEYEGKKYARSRGLTAAIKRAIQEVPIGDPNYLATMTRQDLDHILRGEGELLLMDERLKNINELGKTIQEKYHGDFLGVVEKAGFDALSLAFVTAKDFSSFRDHAWYKGKFIPFLKRAQLLAVDLSAACGFLRGMDWLTALADYRLPQLLHAYGVLQYSPPLEKRIMQEQEVPSGSEEEIEIRAATIQAVQHIKQEFLNHGKLLHAYQIDLILWTTSKELTLPVPHHRTKNIFY